MQKSALRTSSNPLTQIIFSPRLVASRYVGWDDDGIFNFEGGCYAKTINLTHENEPEIYDAIKRDALLENVIIKVTLRYVLFSVARALASVNLGGSDGRVSLDGERVD